MAQDTCAILLWGSFAYLAFLVPRPLSFALANKVASWSKALAFLLLFATLATWPLETARLGEGWPDLFNFEIMSSLLTETNLGPVLTAQTIISIGLLMATFGSSQNLRLPAGFSGLFLATHAIMGHAVMLEGFPSTVLQASYLIHVLAAGAWIGALAPVILIMGQMVKHPMEVHTISLRRFSNAGHVAVVLAVFSGGINAGLIRGRFLPNATSPYDAFLSLKIGLVATMITIAIFNRYVIVPRLRVKDKAVRHLRFLAIFEFVIGLTVLALVNVFSTMNPH